MEKNNDFHNFKILTIYSTVAYLVAYVLVYLSYNIVTGLVGRFYDIKTILVQNKLFFITPDFSALWNFDSAFYVFSLGTVFLFIIFFVMLAVYKHYQYKESIKKIFLFWIVLHCINRASGSFIIGTIFHLYYSNVVLYWLFVGRTYRILLFILVSLFLFFIGGATTKPMLLSTMKFSFVEELKRHYFVLHQAIYPWFISSIILIIVHIPKYAYTENFLSITMLVLLFPSFFNHIDVYLKLPEYDDELPAYKIPWKYIIWGLIIIVTFRVGLHFGIAF